MQKQVHVVKQELVERKILEYVREGEKVTLRIQTKIQMEKTIEEEEIKSPTCGKKVNVETVNEETKEINSEEEEIGIRKCRRKSRIYKINEEVKGWTSSSKQQEYPPERTKTKEETRLERTKIKLKISALEWDDFMLQAQLKSFMYVDRLLRGDPRKDKLIDELNFKNVCN